MRFAFRAYGKLGGPTKTARSWSQAVRGVPMLADRPEHAYSMRGCSLPPWTLSVLEMHAFTTA